MSSGPQRASERLPQLTGCPYQLLKKLGESASAWIFIAEGCAGAPAELLGRRIALKLRKRSPDPEQEIITAARFRRGAELQRSCAHEGLLPAKDYREGPWGALLVTPLCEGGSLRARILREGPLPWRSVIELGLRLLGALELLAERGLVHRDIKPENILFEQAEGAIEEACLSDFGIARSLSTDSGLTGPGLEIGTLTYFSPERAAGAPATPSDDLYSLHLVLYESLIGSLPRSGRGIGAHFGRLYDGVALPQLSTLRPIPSSLSLFFDRALSPAIEHRPPDHESARWALQQLLQLNFESPPSPWAEELLEAPDWRGAILPG